MGLDKLKNASKQINAAKRQVVDGSPRARKNTPIVSSPKVIGNPPVPSKFAGQRDFEGAVTLKTDSFKMSRGEDVLKKKEF